MFPIRFTFHYASTYTKIQSLWQAFRLIYIPLCFYLYDDKRLADNSKNRFTFHYASTYTLSPEGYRYTGISFTFHYASTYTSFRSHPKGLRLHLHSTMLLLIPDFPLSDASAVPDLHSTMLLLILNSQ